MVPWGWIVRWWHRWRKGKMALVARRMRPADRSAILGDVFFRVDERTLDQSQASTHVLEEDGDIVGVAVGLRPSSTDSPANWGDILLKEPDNMAHWVKLMLVKVQDAVADGWTEGFTTTRRRNLLDIGESYFGIQAIEVGWIPSEGEEERVAVEWEFRTDLVSFLDKLRQLDGAF